MKKLGFLVFFLTGLISVLANASQIAMFLGIDLNSTSHARGEQGPLPHPLRHEKTEPTRRPARLVLIVQNVSETGHFASLIGPLVRRLIPEDRLLVIAFNDDGPQVILDPTSRAELESKIHNLVPVSKLPHEGMKLAVADARRWLELNPNANVTSAFIVLSAQTNRATLESWFDRIRSHTSETTLKFGTRIVEGNRRS